MELKISKRSSAPEGRDYVQFLLQLSESSCDVARSILLGVLAETDTTP
jgi:hypothetical protein